MVTARDFAAARSIGFDRARPADRRHVNIAFVLRGLRFRHGMLTIQLDRDARNYLLDAVLARIGCRSR